MDKIILTILMFIGTSSNNFFGTSSAIEELIKGYFNFDTKLESIQYEIPKNIKSEIEKTVGQKFFKDYLLIWKIYKGNEHISTGIIDNVYGKSQPITFLVLFDKNNEIMICEIIKYREAYGGQISNKKWLEQFNGKNHSSSYQLGEDISTISGATISVNSITKGIRKLSLLMNRISKDL